MEDKYAPLGGQAVVEGVLMRSPDMLALAVRRPDTKEIILTTRKIEKNTMSKLSKIPFVRGIVALIDSLKVGTWALNLSADIVIKDFEVAEKEGRTISEDFDFKEPSKVTKVSL